jgi:hypothetical protein
MFTTDTLAAKAGAILFAKAATRFEVLLAEHGVSDLNDVPRALQNELYYSNARSSKQLQRIFPRQTCSSWARVSSHRTLVGEPARA